MVMQIDGNKEINFYFNTELFTPKTNKNTTNENVIENKEVKNEKEKNNKAYDVKLSEEVKKEMAEKLEKDRELQLEKIKNAISLVNDNIPEAMEKTSHGMTMKSLNLVA